MSLGPIEAARVFTFDIARARAFYAERLGLRLRWADDGAAVFDAGPCMLVVESCRADEPEERALVGRFAGLSFSVADAEAAYAELSSAGVDFVEPPERQGWGGVLAHFRDPDGNVLTIVQYPDRSDGSAGPTEAPAEPRVATVSPVVPVRDVEATARFYERHLGFRAGFLAEDRSYGIVGRDGTAIHLIHAEDEQALAATRTNISIFIEVADIDALWAEVEASQPPTKVRALEKTPWGLREFHILDPDGCLLRFGEDG